MENITQEYFQSMVNVLVYNTDNDSDSDSDTEMPILYDTDETIIYDSDSQPAVRYLVVFIQSYCSSSSSSSS